MSNKGFIFNISFPKTGTTSVEAALQILGFSVAHGTWRSSHTNYLYANYVNDNIDELLYFVERSKFNCFSDGPWFSPDLYRVLEKEFPNAKFILTVRDPDKWFESLSAMILKTGGHTDNIDGIYKGGQYGFKSWYKKVFKTSALDKKILIDVYNKHNESAISFFKDKPNKLIQLKLESLDWEPMCTSLGKKVPNARFPWKNFRGKIPGGKR